MKRVFVPTWCTEISRTNRTTSTLPSGLSPLLNKCQSTERSQGPWCSSIQKVPTGSRSSHNVRPIKGGPIRGGCPDSKEAFPATTRKGNLVRGAKDSETYSIPGPPSRLMNLDSRTGGEYLSPWVSTTLGRIGPSTSVVFRGSQSPFSPSLIPRTRMSISHPWCHFRPFLPGTVTL